MVPTCFHFPSQNPSKSLQKPILKGIDFLIDFDIDFKTAQEGPKTAQDGDPSAKTAPRGPQDGPKMAPRGPKSWGADRVFSILAAKSPQGCPQVPPRRIFGAFLLDFWSIFDGFCIDFWLIFVPKNALGGRSQCRPLGALGGQDRKDAKAMRTFGASWGNLGGVLGASWGRLGAWIAVVGRLGAV